MEEGGIGDEYELYIGKACMLKHARRQFTCSVKLFERCGLAVTGEGNVVDAFQFWRRAVEWLVFPKLAAGTNADHLCQLIGKHLHIHLSIHRRNGAVDAAVDTVEVADLVRIQIHANRQALAATGDDGVDIPVRLPGPVVKREKVDRLACHYAGYSIAKAEKTTG